MYLPAQFEETDAAAIQGLIAAHPLAAVVAQTAQGLVANHIPLLMTGERELCGHIARANDLHRVVGNGDEVLAIFRGVDGYVSPNWYPSKSDHHRHVPTWNYQVVHVHGRVHFEDDEKARRRAVGLLTKQLEAATNGAAAWKMADAPRDYMAAMLDSIVAFRIEITRITGKSKLSQNRDPGDFEHVVETLEQRGRGDLAARMRRSRGEA